MKVEICTNMNTTLLPKKKGVPYDLREILLEKIAWEDTKSHIGNVRPVTPPEILKKEINVKPTIMTRHMFLSQVMGFAQSIIRI
jgi:hypothetical protein